MPSACDAPGSPEAERVERPQRPHVHPDRGVGGALRRAGPRLHPRVVGGRDHQGALVDEPGDDGLRQAGALVGVGAGGGLVEQHQRPPAGGLHDRDEPAHVGGEGGEALRDRLVVADVGQHPVEHRHRGPARPAPAARTGGASPAARASSAPRSCRPCWAATTTSARMPSRGRSIGTAVAGSSSGWRAARRSTSPRRLHRAAAPRAATARRTPAPGRAARAPR